MKMSMENEISEEASTWAKEYEKANASDGDVKLWNYFVSLTKREDFIADVNELCTRWKISFGGYKTADPGRVIEPGEWSVCLKTHGERQQLYEDIDGRVIPPEEWSKGIRTHGESLRFYEDVAGLSEKYGLHPTNWEQSMLLYIFYKELYRGEMTCRQGVCYLQDVIEDKKDPYSEEVQRWDNTNFPIALRISPYASEKNIIDYIKRVYKMWIDPIQKRYRKPNLEIGRVRSRKKEVSERNDYVYDHRDEPHAIIMKGLRERFGFNGVIDQAHIAAIIREEKRRRAKK